MINHADNTPFVCTICNNNGVIGDYKLKSHHHPILLAAKKYVDENFHEIEREFGDIAFVYHDFNGGIKRITEHAFVAGFHAGKAAKE
jgi:hypothetical protein